MQFYAIKNCHSYQLLVDAAHQKLPLLMYLQSYAVLENSVVLLYYVLHSSLLQYLQLYINVKVEIKVKQSRNRPSVAQSIPGGLGSQIS